MIHFILTSAQRDSLLNHRGNVIDRLRENNVDLDPIELMDGTYCLPGTIVQNIGFKRLKERLEDAGIDISSVTRRDVDPSEVRANRRGFP
jgi:hypothetical protein